MNVEKFLDMIGSEFYTGVPDSQLKALCNFLMDKYGIDSQKHIIAANEGNCTAIAAGYHLATGKIPVIYMQNSGEGNIINPTASLLNDNVYAIPCIFIIGWRGEPGIHDEPQHIYQGKVTQKLLEDMDIDFFVVGKETTDKEVDEAMNGFRKKLSLGKSAAFVIRKGALEYEGKINYKNDNTMIREDIIKHITAVSECDPIISTTGKISRELYEIRESNNQGHDYDFLTVGSMGHASSIAMGIAVSKPGTRIWCIDGDGAVLMHMGSMAVLGAHSIDNIVHVVINNEAHETVGGMPTVAGKVDLTGIAKACGYPYAVCVNNFDDLDRELTAAKQRRRLSFIEVKCAVGSRADLGRPATSPIENKDKFMRYINQLN